MKMIIKDEALKDQIVALFQSGGPEPGDTFEFVSCEMFDEWRWGVIKLLVVRDKADGKLWGITVKEQTGDDYYCSLEEDSEITLEPVVAVERVEYVLETWVKR